MQEGLLSLSSLCAHAHDTHNTPPANKARLHSYSHTCVTRVFARHSLFSADFGVLGSNPRDRTPLRPQDFAETSATVELATGTTKFVAKKRIPGVAIGKEARIVD